MKSKDWILIVSLTLLLIIGVGYYNHSVYFIHVPEEIEYPDSLIHEIEVQREYGFNLDSFNIEKHKVKRNQFLSDILLSEDVSYGQIDQLIRNSKDIFDPKRVKYGNRYAFVKSKDTTSTQLYFVYENDPIEFTVFELFDSLQVKLCQKEVKTITQLSKGVIESSLWNTMKDEELNPMLAIELSEIYAWTIDFFGIQKNDSFLVLYDESFVDSVSIGIQKVYVACFYHMGYENWAYGFVQDSAYSFFDERGLSLRKAFLKAPLRYSRISSKFSNSRYHPVLKIRRPHHGVDYAAPRGTPVFSIGDGKIVERGYQRAGGGNYLKIKHNSVYTSVYMHLDKFGKNMTVGKQVRQGDMIGTVGSTGLATGPHLDFRIFKNGHPVDPLKVESPPVDPILEENAIPFEATMKHYQKILGI